MDCAYNWLELVGIGWNRAIESKNLVVIMIVSSSETNQINVNKTFCQATMVTLYDNMV